nr:hypothetical protein [Haloactinopolyspora sp.]
MALPLLDTAPKMPKAFPRAGVSANDVASSDSVAGAMSAPEMPWSARATTSMGKPVAKPPTSEAPTNPLREISSSRLRPKVSASRPPTSRRLPNVSA